MRFHRVILLFGIFLLSLGFVFTIFYRSGLILDSIGIHVDNPISRRINIPEDFSKVDRNNNGIPDPIDIVMAARKEVEKKTKYMSGYYAGGYPPNEEGVCTDIIWRGLMGANINLKELMDEDIKMNTGEYARVNGKPESNIDFRRVPNQYVFFERFTQSLTTELIPRDIENLKQWQPGDIVVFLEGFHHVAIISDKRAKDGTPYIIHNSPPFAAEVKLKSIKTPIAGHYRWIY
ncbi:DUF1287 domain-containing protein [Alkaliphilus peptidifermentans]|uniref:DUF1287 domain-containing protein n=1 Tax=Alkaliphilus peptidifermentans DSM 18978 TaxID=1120976 RepID=A0A1G5KQM8_9FIRM|nr:DUF1287 domain-containing protein [Alkaliphilus peptidifermentans]SCZ02408.1 hypothetical protein SAMN03080606_03657 [Alkaliphilus peptidifermentans DSM 18978]